jgi:hypothetical protein
MGVSRTQRECNGNADTYRRLRRSGKQQRLLLKKATTKLRTAVPHERAEQLLAWLLEALEDVAAQGRTLETWMIVPAHCRDWKMA